MHQDQPTTKLHLSSIYGGRFKWGMVYHTSFDSEEVEMFKDDKFFDTEKEAWDWFHENYRVHNFIQPEAVKFHLGGIKISRQE